MKSRPDFDKKTGSRQLSRRTMLVACKCGIDGISLEHYDCGTFTNTEAIRPALDYADIQY